jgi:formate hydrogenlyase subunit 6/NADH:ubiquinone oxidoreductase subunit I
VGESRPNRPARAGITSALWLPGMLRSALARRDRAERKDARAKGVGIPRLIQDAAGRLRCVSCQLCAAACPSNCIAIEGPAAPWNGEGNAPLKFEIDMGRCIRCGYCETACPAAAIALQPAASALGRQRHALVWDIDRLTAAAPAVAGKQKAG